MPLGVVLFKEGVSLSATVGPYVGTLAPGGVRILSAVETTARKLGRNLTVTSACDGEHSGPLDPHKKGEALDVRSHDFDEATKPVILNCFLSLLPADQFYCFLEDPGQDGEHWHLQVRKNTTYP